MVANVHLVRLRLVMVMVICTFVAVLSTIGHTILIATVVVSKKNGFADSKSIFLLPRGYVGIIH